MNIEKLINELKTFGYDLYLEDENIRYKFHSLVEPPKERIAVLLDSLKRNKAEVISYLRAKESQNKPLSSHETGLDIQEEAAYCLWLKQDVPKDECHKPFGCFYRKEDDTPVECVHLKAFIRQRNRELELNG